MQCSYQRVYSIVDFCCLEIECVFSCSPVCCLLAYKSPPPEMGGRMKGLGIISHVLVVVKKINVEPDYNIQIIAKLEEIIMSFKKSQAW